MMTSILARLFRLFGKVPFRGQVALMHAVTPHFSMGALAVIRNDAGEILLVRQGYKPDWGLPGGIAKRGEEPSATAVRETREETGLRIELIGEPIVDIDVAIRKVDVLYRARVASGAQPSDARAIPPEIIECRWFSTTDLPALQPEAVSGLKHFPNVR
jgi:8-oxo-dGTP diphosphatase